MTCSNRSQFKATTWLWIRAWQISRQAMACISSKTVSPSTSAHGSSQCLLQLLCSYTWLIMRAQSRLALSRDVSCLSWHHYKRNAVYFGKHPDYALYCPSCCCTNLSTRIQDKVHMSLIFILILRLVDSHSLMKNYCNRFSAIIVCLAPCSVSACWHPCTCEFPSVWTGVTYLSLST